MIQQRKQASSLTKPITGYPKRAVRKQLLPYTKAKNCIWGGGRKAKAQAKKTDNNPPPKKKHPTSYKRTHGLCMGPKSIKWPLSRPKSIKRTRVLRAVSKQDQTKTGHASLPCQLTELLQLNEYSGSNNAKASACKRAQEF